MIQPTEQPDQDLILHPKELEKEEQKQPKVSRRKEVIKIRAEWNEIEDKKYIQKTNTTKSWFLKRLIQLTNLWLD